MSIDQAAPADGEALGSSARSWPAVSVVVPTRGRADSVARLLATLTAAGSRYPGEAEVVVSDASTGTDRGKIRRMAAAAGARVVRGPVGIGAQRNRGWRTARGELVVFVDSDCTATPGLLPALVAAFADPSVTAVAGRVRFAGPRSLPLNAAVATGVVAAFDGFGKQAGERIPWAATANLAVRRTALVAVDGFDERLPAGEDVDLGLRLSQLGELRYAPDALVEHHTETWDAMAETAVRFFRYGRADAHLRRAHPALRGGVEPSVLPALLLALADAAWRTARGRPHPAAPVAAGLLSLAGMWGLSGWRARPHGATTVLALALMECLSAGRAVEAVRLGRWGDVWRGVVLDDGQRKREAGRRRRAWQATVASGIAVVAAAGGGRWLRSWS
jgi:GT2 family glycosyltransferase